MVEQPLRTLIFYVCIVLYRVVVVLVCSSVVFFMHVHHQCCCYSSWLLLLHKLLSLLLLTPGYPNMTRACWWLDPSSRGCGCDREQCLCTNPHYLLLCIGLFSHPSLGDRLWRGCQVNGASLQWGGGGREGLSDTWTKSSCFHYCSEAAGAPRQPGLNYSRVYSMYPVALYYCY